MAKSKKRTAEIQAGAVVLIGLVILVLGLYYIGGGADQFRGTTKYTVFLANAGGLKEGYDVQLDGRMVGEVAEVRAAKDSERPATINGREYGNFSVAVAEIFSDERIPEDSSVEITRSITGTVSMLIFSGKSTKRADEKTILQGRARADFEKATDEAVALVNEAKSTVAAATEVVKRIDTEVKELRIKDLRASIDAFLAKADRFAASASDWIDQAADPAHRAVLNAEEGLQDFKHLAKEIRTGWNDEVKPGLTGTLDQAQGILKENRPAIKSFLQKLDDAGSLANETLLKIQELSVEIRGTVAESRPHLVTALRDAAKGMGNFKDATTDLKAAPWKLLNKPSAKEVETVYLHDGAKIYVEAAREVRAAVDDLQTLERLGALNDEKSKAAVERATQRLQEAAARMKENEALIAKLIAR
ncbi:MAG: MlaD family protein [Planctomycetota bacterium]|jgi:ABC-type transporter Mla subunit MlaD